MASAPPEAVLSAHSFMAGGGEMGVLTRKKDWSAHPLGAPENWDPTLKTLLALVLSSRFPMFIFWGPESYGFYNDAYRPSLGVEGKHPAILGMPGEEAWPEIWPTIKPLIDQVLSGGGGTWSEDQLIPIHRNGHLEDVYWTFGYSPIKNGAGEVLGVLVTCTETTGKVRTLQLLQESERRLNAVIMQAPVAIALFNGPQHAVEMVNDRALELWGRRIEEVRHRPILEALPELRTQGFADIFDSVHAGERFSATELPVRLQRDGELRTAYVNFVYEPIRAPDGRVQGLLAVGAEVTDTVIARKKVETSASQFRLLADSMPQFVWTADEQGHLNYFNRAVFDYSGLTEHQLREEGWLQIVHPEERERNSAAWTESIRTGADFHFEHRFRHHDGSYRWQLSRAVPVRDGDGRIHMWVGTSTDIQEMKVLAQHKDHFISTASHELRNPLNILATYVDLLQLEFEDAGPGLVPDALKVMDRQVKSLTALTTDLLDVSKMTAGAIALHSQHLDLGELVDRVVEEMQHLHTGHRFLHTAPLKAMVFADPSRLAQVLTNLLTNAVKYAPQARDITLRTVVADGSVTVSVQDRGIGISAADKQRIFQRFYRVQGTNESTYTGFGIGLYIAAEIVQLHGGTIGVDSTPGKGSMFHFTLPLVPAP